MIVASSLQHVRSMLDESLRLFLAGETLASMWAGQATWEAAASLHDSVNDKRPVQAGRKLVSKADKANAYKSAHADKQHAAWQTAAEKKWASPQHSNKSASAIAKLIAGDNWNTARRFIKPPGE